MQKYRNATQSTIAIDCFTRTIYIRPGEIVTLPETMDVRYYSRLSQLVLVKSKSKESKIRVATFKPKRANKNKN
jgi:hypothetical protein